MPGQENVDRESATPIYQQVAAIIRARIESGEFVPDRAIPSESAIEEQYHVSRGTVRKAIAELREQGLVVTTRGRGSYVTPYTPRDDSASQAE